MPSFYRPWLVIGLGLGLAASTHAQASAPTASSSPAAASSAGVQPSTAPVLPLAPWPRPADAPALISEDFESGAVDDKKWTLHVAGRPNMTVEQDHVAHGKNALHIHYPTGTTNKEYAFLSLQLPETLRNHFYGRAYVSITGAPPRHSVLLFAGSTGFPLADFLEIGIVRGEYQPSFQLNKPTPDRPVGERYFQLGAPPVARWFCLEWEFIDQPDRIVMWEDGKLVVNQPITYQIVKPNGPIVEGGLTGGFFELNIGFDSHANPVPGDVDVYYDDIAISDKPIGQLTPVPVPAAK